MFQFVAFYLSTGNPGYRSTRFSTRSRDWDRFRYIFQFG